VGEKSIILEEIDFCACSSSASDVFFERGRNTSRQEKQQDICARTQKLTILMKIQFHLEFS